MQASNDVLSEAFRVLDSSVRDLCSFGRHCLGARLKPELRRRTRQNFSEQQLGFAKFGDFLRAAERAGVIHLAFTPGGDLEAWPARERASVLKPELPSGNSYLPQPITPPRALPIPPTAAIRVRDDLWNAFNSFTGLWVYDPKTDIARRIPESAGSRAGLETQLVPDLVRIPSGRDRVIDWMRSFSGTQDPTTKTQLLTILSGDSPVYRFKGTVRLDPNLDRAWRRYHVQQIVAAIEAWSSSNNVHPKDIISPFRRPQFRSGAWPTPPPTVQSETQPKEPSAVLPVPLPSPVRTVPQPATSVLTPRLASLIDELINELLRLRGTLGAIDSGA